MFPDAKVAARHDVPRVATFRPPNRDNPEHVSHFRNWVINFGEILTPIVRGRRVRAA